MKKKLINGKTLSYYLKHPGALRQVDRTELKSLLNEYPYSSHLHLLAAIKDHLEFGMVSQDLLEKAAVYIADRRRLGEWMNKLQSLRKEDSFLFPEDEPVGDLHGEEDTGETGLTDEEDEMVKELVFDSLEEDESNLSDNIEVDHQTDAATFDEEEDMIVLESSTEAVSQVVEETILSIAALQEFITSRIWPFPDQEENDLFSKDSPTGDEPETIKIPDELAGDLPDIDLVEAEEAFHSSADIEGVVGAATSIDDYLTDRSDEDTSKATVYRPIKDLIDELISAGSTLQWHLENWRKHLAAADFADLISEIILSGAALNTFLKEHGWSWRQEAEEDPSFIEDEVIYDLKSSEPVSETEATPNLEADEMPGGIEAPNKQSVFYDPYKEEIQSSEKEEAEEAGKSKESAAGKRTILEGEALKRALEAEKRWGQHIGVLDKSQDSGSQEAEEEHIGAGDVRIDTELPVEQERSTESTTIEYLDDTSHSEPVETDEASRDDLLSMEDISSVAKIDDSTSDPDEEPLVGEEPRNAEELIEAELSDKDIDVEEEEEEDSETPIEAMDARLSHMEGEVSEEQKYPFMSEPAETPAADSGDEGEEDLTWEKEHETSNREELYEDTVYKLDEDSLQPISTDGDPESPFLKWLHSLGDSKSEGYNDWEKRSKDEKTVEDTGMMEEEELEDLPDDGDEEKGKKKKKKKKKKSWKMDSLRPDEALVSEALAELLANQGHTKRAIKMYEKLRLIIPEKSVFFAQKIEELENKK